jgi:hypothetical protein
MVVERMRVCSNFLQSFFLSNQVLILTIVCIRIHTLIFRYIKFYNQQSQLKKPVIVITLEKT